MNFMQAHGARHLEHIYNDVMRTHGHLEHIEIVDEQIEVVLMRQLTTYLTYYNLLTTTP